MPHRPASRRRTLMSLYELSTLAHARHNIFDRWELPADDLQAKDAAPRLKTIWGKWSHQRKEELLLAVEGIARAEADKHAWNPRVQRERYEHLAKSAVSAARLAEDIATLFPPPWRRDQREIGTLVHKLDEFINAAYIATTFPARRRSASRARNLVQRVKPATTTKTRRMPPWELVRDLVWLASEGKVQPSERTIRRYLDEERRAKSPATLYWRRNWDLLRRVSRLTRTQGDINQFARALGQYLERPS